MQLLIVWLVFSGQKRAVQRQDVSNYASEMWATEWGRDRHSGKNSLTVTPWIFSANISTNYFTLPNMLNKQACKQTFSVWIIHHILSFNKLVDCVNLSCIRGKFDLFDASWKDTKIWNPKKWHTNVLYMYFSSQLTNKTDTSVTSPIGHVIGDVKMDISADWLIDLLDILKFYVWRFVCLGLGACGYLQS